MGFKTFLWVAPGQKRRGNLLTRRSRTTLTHTHTKETDRKTERENHIPPGVIYLHIPGDTGLLPDTGIASHGLQSPWYARISPANGINKERFLGLVRAIHTF